MTTRADSSDPWTSVKIRESTRTRLRVRKIHPGQSYNEIVIALIDLADRLDDTRDTP